MTASIVVAAVRYDFLLLVDWTARYRPRATTLHTPNSLKFKLPCRADFLPQPISSARPAVLPCCVALSSVCCFPELFSHFESHPLSFLLQQPPVSHRRRPILRSEALRRFPAVWFCLPFGVGGVAWLWGWWWWWGNHSKHCIGKLGVVELITSSCAGVVVLV